MSQAARCSLGSLQQQLCSVFIVLALLPVDADHVTCRADQSRGGIARLVILNRRSVARAAVHKPAAAGGETPADPYPPSELWVFFLFFPACHIG